MDSSIVATTKSFSTYILLKSDYLWILVVIALELLSKEFHKALVVLFLEFFVCLQIATDFHESFCDLMPNVLWMILRVSNIALLEKNVLETQRPQIQDHIIEALLRIDLDLEGEGRWLDVDLELGLGLT